jgi:hypothetical protein
MLKALCDGVTRGRRKQYVARVFVSFEPHTKKLQTTTWLMH